MCEEDEGPVQVFRLLAQEPDHDFAGLANSQVRHRTDVPHVPEGCTPHLIVFNKRSHIDRAFNLQGWFWIGALPEPVRS